MTAITDMDFTVPVPEPPHRARLQDRIPVDVITAEARRSDPGRAFLAVVAALIFAPAWIIGKVFTVLWAALAWMFAAARIGWRQSRGLPLQQPTIEDVIAQNEQVRRENEGLRAELSRIMIK
jgi:hypothetical protein